MRGESEEFTKLRRDLEDQEAHKADPRWNRRYVPLPSNRIKEVDPRERD